MAEIPKQLLEETDKIFKEYKRKKIMRKILRITCVFLLLVIYPFLAQFAKDIKSLYEILIYFYVLLVVSAVTNFFVSTSLLYQSEKNEEHLSIWIENIRGHDPISKFLPLTKMKGSTLENLNSLEKYIREYCANDDKNLRLLRSYYYTLKNNNEQVMWHTIIGVIVVFFGYIMKEVLFDDFSVIIWGAKLSPTMLTIIFVIILSSFYSKILVKRDKTLLVYKVIDEIVNSNDK